MWRRSATTTLGTMRPLETLGLTDLKNKPIQQLSKEFTMSEVEETLERIKHQKGVEGYVIADRQGNVLRRHPQMQMPEAEKYAAYMKELTTKARGVVRDLNPKNDLQYMRVRVKKLELLVAHEKDFLVVVIQKWAPANN